jgi:hypothetical protein
LCESARLRASPISFFGRLAIYQNQGFSIGPVADVSDEVHAIDSCAEPLCVALSGVARDAVKIVKHSFGVVGIVRSRAFAGLHRGRGRHWS